MNNDWCILRTSSRHTIPLSERLAEDGFEVWTPIETRTIRVPRQNVKREIRLPIMPSYVFARAHHLIDLIQRADLPIAPTFSVMHAFGDQIPLVREQHLTKLRELEIKKTPKRKAERTFDPGVIVRVGEGGGSFSGMTGAVRKSDKGYTLVCFNERYTIKINTLLLCSDSVCDETEIAALKAA
jgi:hypothetical protein